MQYLSNNISIHKHPINKQEEKQMNQGNRIVDAQYQPAPDIELPYRFKIVRRGDSNGNGNELFVRSFAKTRKEANCHLDMFRNLAPNAVLFIVELEQPIADNELNAFLPQ